VPIDASARAVKRLVPSAKLVIYAGGPHGITDTHKERLNDDLLSFIKS
jgi:non-heme chloroperoxidase